MKNKFSSTIISRSSSLLRSLSLHLQFCICLLHCIYILVWLLQILPFSLCMFLFFLYFVKQKKIREPWHFFYDTLKMFILSTLRGLQNFSCDIQISLSPILLKLFTTMKFWNFYIVFALICKRLWIVSFNCIIYILKNKYIKFSK